ncbi:CorA family divalent cation transporter [Aliagarivorans marinus]|uniref:CorA family divalent cation transporter n=1 Tax=Aliagarivorans marinus TaxID=561965 RepID=UPI00041A6BDE|nr:CorA family divalent cation transporter [Aliagarivorans marinus]
MDEFIVSAWHFDQAGQRTPIAPASNHQIAPGEWLHLQRGGEAVRPWLERQGLPLAIIDFLLAEDTRPRCEVLSADTLLLNVRGVNLNQGAQPDDMLSVRILWHRGALLSVRKLPSQSVRLILDQLDAGSGPESLGDVVIAIVNGLNAHIDNYLSPVELLIEEDAPELPQLAAEQQRRLLKLKRYLKPQSAVLDSLERSQLSLFSEHQLRLKNASDNAKRIFETVEFILEQLHSTLLEQQQAQAEKMNRNTYLLSIVAGVFVPAGFLTGLLGVNIAGIPGTDTPWAFAAFCGGLTVAVAIEVWVLKKLQFI